MNVITALKVFGGSSLLTERGELKISRVFPDAKAASKARYYYYGVEEGIAVYARRGKTGGRLFAVAGE
jgi:hypothetical protein